jgi:hypothetical protein
MYRAQCKQGIHCCSHSRYLQERLHLHTPRHALVLCFHGSDRASCSYGFTTSTSTSSLFCILLSLPNLNTMTQPPSCTTKNPASLIPRRHEVVPTLLSGAILSRLLPATAEAASGEFPLEHLNGSSAEQLNCDDVESLGSCGAASSPRTSYMDAAIF